MNLPGTLTLLCHRRRPSKHACTDRAVARLTITEEANVQNDLSCRIMTSQKRHIESEKQSMSRDITLLVQLRVGEVKNISTVLSWLTFYNQHVRRTLLQSDVVTALFPVTLVTSRSHRY